jgi:hypothetical protein
MPNEWTISQARGQRDAADLIGCHITINAAGTAYQFTGPNPSQVLSTTTGGTLPTPPFDFPEFPFPGLGPGVYDWRIHVQTLTGGVSQTRAEGTWRNNDPATDPTDDETGTWTAQAGSGVDEDGKEDAAAASA